MRAASYYKFLIVVDIKSRSIEKAQQILHEKLFVYIQKKLKSTVTKSDYIGKETK